MSPTPDISKQKGASRNAIATPGRRRGGSAIVIVLLLIFLLTISVVSFFLLVQDDRQRSHSFLDVIRTQIMIESASQEAIAKIMDGSEIPYTTSGVGSGETYRAQANMTASPGLMEVRYYDQAPNRGYETGATAFTSTNAFFQNPFSNQYQVAAGTWAQANPQLIPLFSWKWYAPAIRYLKITGGTPDTSSTNSNYNPAAQFNINTSANPFYPGELYLSGLPTATVAAKAAYQNTTAPSTSTFSTFQFKTGESSLDKPVFVQWIPIYENPSLPPGSKNKVIGRYAYWVDVENTKVNLNTSTRLFDASPANVIEGKSEADTHTGSSRYNVLGPTTSLGSSSFGTSTNSATYNRDIVERKLWKTAAGGNEISMDGSSNQGNNDAAVNYFNLWFGWTPTASDPQWYLPLAADNSMVDWRVFTGMRPYGTSGQGTNVSVEQLTTSYGTNIPSKGAFNTWLESYSMLDPMVEQNDSTLGQLTLATMRRTHSLSTTIYGYEDELDPLGRPKLDIVTFQKDLPGGNTYNEIWNRLGDANYHSAYYPKAFPNAGANKSFMQSFNGFAGDLDPSNSANGEAVVNQMLVNIYSYGQPHTTTPASMLTGLQHNTNGVWPAKSMPYVAEVATRARSAMLLLDPTNRNITNFFTNTVVSGTTYWTSVNNPSLTGTDGVSRPNFWYLTNVLIDLGFGFVNPNPFATNTNVTTLTVQAEGTNFWHGLVAGNSDVPDARGATNASFTSVSDTLAGAYAIRPSPVSVGSGAVGFRASGSNCYFPMGAIPSAYLTNAQYGTLLQIKGWQLTDASGAVFHQVPMPNLGQTGTPRSWWQMALTGNNAGPIYHMTSLAWYRTGSITTPTGGRSYPNFAPPYVDRAVGWFTPKTICEVTNSGLNAIFPGLIYPPAIPAYGPGMATMTNIPDNVFRTNWGLYQSLTNQFVNCTNVSMVERVQCVDPVIGHRTGNPANTITASSATGLTYIDTAFSATPRQVQGAVAGSTLAGHFYGVAGHPWRLYDNYASASVTNVIAPVPSTIPVTNSITVQVQVPVGVSFVTVPYTYDVVTQVPGGGPSSGGGTNVSAFSPLSCLTKPFDNPGTTRTNQAEWDGSYIPQYGGFYSYNQSGQNGEASVIWTTKNGVQWPADLEDSTVTYAGPAATVVGGNGWYFDSRTGATGIRGTGNAGTVSPPATLSTPWGIVDSAPRGEAMTSIGELGFVHSGFLQHPINLSGVQYLRMANYGGAPVSVLDSPQNGPPMSMLLDLFTPHAFRDYRDTSTGHGLPVAASQGGWFASSLQNTPSNPRRGTVNVNESVASDFYMAIREGYSTSGSNSAGTGGAVRANPATMAVRPAWIPSAMFFRKSNNPAKDESDLNNDTQDGGRLDAFMQPVPRYRRGWDSVISMIGGDFSPFREMGEGAWLGRGGTSTDAGVGYMSIGAPLGTWRTGNGFLTQSPFAQFDTLTGYGGASQLLTLGREVTQNDASTVRGFFTGHFASDGVSFDVSGTNNITTFLSTGVNPEAKGNLWQATRFAITPLRHFISEIPYDTTGQRDVYMMHSGRMSVTPDAGNIHTALNMGPPAMMPAFPNNGLASSPNGTAGIMHQMGIYNSAFMEQAANLASTSANAFTIHVVAQAIKNTGQVRTAPAAPGYQGNSGPGYMNTDDQVLAEQWAQIVVERIPKTNGGDVLRDTNGAPINDYKILYYRILDNAK